MTEITTETKVELLKLATEIVLSNSDKSIGGVLNAANVLGLPKKPHGNNLLEILDQVYAHLLAKVNE